MKSILKDEKGQNIVEFALVAPLLFLLVLGITEFGRAWMTRNVLTGAAREAVRVAAVQPPVGGVDAAISRATTLLASAGITPKSVLPSEETVDGQTLVKITIAYDFQSAAGNILGFGTIPLTCSTTMRKEY
jgi:Flp pilus assembly protein TadG